VIDQEIHKVLKTIYPILTTSPFPWAITGSLGFALQGMDTEVHDVDIQTDRPGAYEIERRLSAYSIRPVAFSGTERIRSHFGALEIRGVRVEIMGDIQKRMPDGRWEEPVDVTRFLRWTIWDGMRIPVLSLEYEYRAYLIMGRIEKAETLRKWMETSAGKNPAE